MKAEELMRFDWVRLVDDNTPRQVDWIRSGEVGLFWGETVTLPYLEPIPLTPEILEKNGFIKQNFDGWEYIYPDDCTFCYIGYRILWRTDYDNHLFIKKYKGSNTSATLQISYINFVHQLQQALKLCGIEKTIEL